MADEGATLGDKALRQIAIGLRDIRRLKKDDRSSSISGNARQENYQVKWDVDIDAATNSATTPGLGTATIWAKVEGGDLYDTGRFLDVVNRSESSSYTAEDWGKVERINGEWQPYTGTGGKNCNDIRFQILASDSLSRTALCVITARPYGCSWADIPDTIYEGQAVEVCDPSGCFFNGTHAELIAREGWAKYMQPVSGSSWCQGYSPYYGTQPEWEVYSLCCRVDTCSL